MLTNFARVCGVGFAKMSLYATSMFFFDAEITILVAVSDVPPRSKKLSSAKTLSSSRISAKMLQNVFSSSFFGNRPLSYLLLLGSGRTFVLTLPFGVRGILSS
ncbi:hypothetical protein DW960_01915 [Ruminococcus bromii]|nr:hypothetical protein DW960_01915 [Ruminococcus bromii]